MTVPSPNVPRAAALAVSSVVNTALLDYYRCPDSFALVACPDRMAGPLGYFSVGDDLTLYGHCTAGAQDRLSGRVGVDASRSIRVTGGRVELPFDPTEVVDNLRLERYQSAEDHGGAFGSARPLRRLYYWIRPALPVSVRKHLQSAALRGWEQRVFPRWPVDDTVGQLHEKTLMLREGWAH